MFLIGFQGLAVSPEIRHLIEHYYIGCIIFARRNITGIFSVNLTNGDSVQTAKLIHELQQTAHDAGHDQPLLIALDQEHGMVYSRKYR
jgi:beta-N-acetylhexosaminidase